MKSRALYSITEARELLGGMSRNTIYQLLHTGQLVSVVIGSRRFISQEAISKLIEASTTSLSPALDAARERKPNEPQPLIPVPAGLVGCNGKPSNAHSMPSL
jgi:excisionase family DNA binding protein